MPYVQKIKGDESSISSGLAKWQTGISYESGNFVYLNSTDTSTSYLSGIFVCISSHVSTTFDNDSSKWMALTSAYSHIQSVSSSTWNVNHGLFRKPSVTLIDSSGFQIVGSIEYTSSTTLIVRLNSSKSGVAYCV